MDIQLKKGVLDMCILQILSKKDSYGYDIAEMLLKYIKVAEGTVYPILRKLKDEGFLTTYLLESTDGPPRKYYKITELGRKRLNKLMDDWKLLNEQINMFLEEK